jgi:hypothetical protein
LREEPGKKIKDILLNEVLQGNAKLKCLGNNFIKKRKFFLQIDFVSRKSWRL